MLSVRLPSYWPTKLHYMNQQQHTLGLEVFTQALRIPMFPVHLFFLLAKCVFSSIIFLSIFTWTPLFLWLILNLEVVMLIYPIRCALGWLTILTHHLKPNLTLGYLSGWCVFELPPQRTNQPVLMCVVFACVFDVQPCSSRLYLMCKTSETLCLSAGWGSCPGCGGTHAAGCVLLGCSRTDGTLWSRSSGFLRSVGVGVHTEWLTTTATATLHLGGGLRTSEPDWLRLSSPRTRLLTRLPWSVDPQARPPKVLTTDENFFHFVWISVKVYYIFTGKITNNTKKSPVQIKSEQRGIKIFQTLQKHEALKHWEMNQEKNPFATENRFRNLYQPYRASGPRTDSQTQTHHNNKTKKKYITYWKTTKITKIIKWALCYLALNRQYMLAEHLTAVNDEMLRLIL